MNQKLFDGHTTLWVVHIGKDDRIALRARDEGFVCIGWTRMGDLSRFRTREAMKDAMRKAWPEWKEGKINSCYGQVYRFAHEMKIGDPVVFPVRSSREIAIGRITGKYQWMENDPDLVKTDYCNLRTVEWLKVVRRTLFSQPALHSFGSFSSVSTSNDFLEEVLTIAFDKKQSGGTELPSPGDGVGLADDDEEVEVESFDLFGTAVQETEDFLLKKWQRTGAAFEHVVAAVLQAIGYTATVTQASGDHGVDVIAHPDPLGLTAPFIKIQVKSGTEKTGEPAVNQLIGSLQSGEKGIFVSLGGFTPAAKSKARNSSNLILVDDEKFVSLFLEHYEKLSPIYRARYPLSRVYVPQKDLP